MKPEARQLLFRQLKGILLVFILTMVAIYLSEVWPVAAIEVNGSTVSASYPLLPKVIAFILCSIVICLMIRWRANEFSAGHAAPLFVLLPFALVENLSKSVTVTGTELRETSLVLGNIFGNPVIDLRKVRSIEITRNVKEREVLRFSIQDHAYSTDIELTLLSRAVLPTIRKRATEFGIDAGGI